MKKIFPLMFSLMFAGQVFAAETDVIATDAVATEVVVNEEEAAKAEVVFNTLKDSGLSGEQIIAVVQKELENETTENEYRSVLKKSNQEKIVWMLVGASILGGTLLAIKYGVPAIKSLFDKKPEVKGDDKGKDEKPAEDKKAKGDENGQQVVGDALQKVVAQPNEAVLPVTNK